MDIDEVIVGSAMAGMGIVDNEKYARLAQAGLTLVAGEFRGHVRPDDQPGLLLVAIPTHTAKDPLGYMLVLRCRTILAWSVGLRPKSDSVVLPITSDGQIVAAGTKPKTWRQPSKLLVDLVGPPTYRVEIPDVGKMEGALHLARGIASGWAKLT